MSVPIGKDFSISIENDAGEFVPVLPVPDRERYAANLEEMVRYLLEKQTLGPMLPTYRQVIGSLAYDWNPNGKIITVAHGPAQTSNVDPLDSWHQRAVMGKPADRLIIDDPWPDYSKIEPLISRKADQLQRSIEQAVSDVVFTRHGGFDSKTGPFTFAEPDWPILKEQEAERMKEIDLQPARLTEEQRKNVRHAPRNRKERRVEAAKARKARS